MAKHQVIIKHRLFTWFETVPSAANPEETVRLEKISHLGDDVDITDEASYQRGLELDAFFSKEDAKAIREGTYDGPQAGALAVMSGQAQRPASMIEPLEDEGVNTDGMDAQALGEYINENSLNVDQTVALAKDGDEDSIQKVYDAEIHAAQLRGNDPRKGVVDTLDAKLAAAASS